MDSASRGGPLGEGGPGHGPAGLPAWGPGPSRADVRCHPPTRLWHRSWTGGHQECREVGGWGTPGPRGQLPSSGASICSRRLGWALRGLLPGPSSQGGQVWPWKPLHSHPKRTGYWSRPGPAAAGTRPPPPPAHLSLGSLFWGSAKLPRGLQAPKQDCFATPASPSGPQ